MLAPVNGMDAVNCKQLGNLTACFGYPIMLSTWMDAVKSYKLKDASPGQGNGCCEL